jgi:hypothetical protein
MLDRASLGKEGRVPSVAEPVEGRNVAASGVEAYRSWRRVRPSEMTGVVA